MSLSHPSTYLLLIKMLEGIDKNKLYIKAWTEKCKHTGVAA